MGPAGGPGPRGCSKLAHSLLILGTGPGTQVQPASMSEIAEKHGGLESAWGKEGLPLTGTCGYSELSKGLTFLVNVGFS